MIRYTCPFCGYEMYVLWKDICKVIKIACRRCKQVMCFVSCTEEDLIRHKITKEQSTYEKSIM